jgi:hypothetical protein
MNHAKNLSLEQVKKIPTNLLARLANEQGNCKNESNLSDEDLSLFCDDEQYAPNYNDYDYGNDYHRSEWDEWEF